MNPFDTPIHSQIRRQASWVCLLMMALWLSPAHAEEQHFEFTGPCFLFPGVIRYFKMTYNVDCYAEETEAEVMAQIEEQERLDMENPFLQAIRRNKRAVKTVILDEPVAAADLSPGQCSWDGQKLVCNFGKIAEGGPFTIRFYATATEPGPFQIKVRTWSKAQGIETALVSPLLTGTVVAKTKRLIYPWISNNAGQFESILVVNNFASEAAQIQLTASRREGLPETVMRSIPAGGSLREKASSLFPNLGSGPGYSVVVESSLAKVSGHWVTNNLVTGSGFSPSQGVAIDMTDLGVPSSRRFGRDIMFGYLPISNGLTSAPVIVNLGETPTDVILRFYDATGRLVLEDRNSLLNLEPMRPFATVINDLVPAGMEDLHMVASADQRLTGVAFVFNQLGEPAIGNIQALTVFEP